MRETRQPGGREPARGKLSLVQDFINTVDLEDGPDHLETVAGLREFLVSNGLITRREKPTERDRAHAVELREALRAFAGANNGASLTQAPLEVLNEFSEALPLVTEFHADGSIELRPVRTGTQAALGKILAAVHDSVVDGSWSRLKACQNPDCQWVFFDRSKNRSGRWCAMAACGSRIKARAYAKRRRRSAAD